MRKILLFLFTCCFKQFLQAQNNVSIFFVDKNNLPIPYVTVHDGAKQIYAMSDVYGKWEIAVNEKDSIELKVESIEFENTIIQLYNIQNDTQQLVF